MMLTPITILSNRTAHKHMQNRLRNCFQGIEDSCNETSIRMLETRAFWDKHYARLEPFVPDYLESLFDIALHPYALAGQADEVIWCMHGGRRLTAEGQIAWIEPKFAKDGEFGHLESKLTSIRAVELVGVMARHYPQAFTSNDVDRLLDISGLTETGSLGHGPNYSLYQTMLELSTANPGIFTDDHREEIHKRRLHNKDYTYALVLELLHDQNYELPLQGGLTPSRPEENQVVFVSFLGNKAPKPKR